MTVTQAPRERTLRRLSPLEAGAHLQELLAQPYEYRGWEDVYRDKWTWDRVVKVTHTRVNCISACSIDAYVKDGVVWREEQNATYEQAFNDVPDYNPRGCPMGCVYSSVMYDPTRIKYPMKRVGARGEGKWQRLSWDQALTEVADRLIDTVADHGADCVVFDHGTTNIDFGIGSPMEAHLFSQGVGSSTIDSWAGVGDLPVGPDPDLGSLQFGRHGRRLVPLRLHPHVDRQPVVYESPGSPFPLRSALPRGKGGFDCPGLQRLDGAR